MATPSMVEGIQRLDLPCPGRDDRRVRHLLIPHRIIGEGDRGGRLEPLGDRGIGLGIGLGGDVEGPAFGPEAKLAIVEDHLARL